MPYDSRSLGPKHISASLSYEPQRTNNFELDIWGLPGKGSTEIMLAVNDASMPTIANPAIDVGQGNAKVHFAGQAEYSGVDTIQVIDYITTDVEKLIRDWHVQVYNPETDEIGWAANYKKQGNLTEFGPDGTCFRVWNIYGIWPNSVNYGGSLSMDGAEVKKIEMSLSYDYAWRVV